MPNNVDISLSRVSSTLEDDFLELRVQDASSGTRIVTVKLELAQLAQLLTDRVASGELKFLLNRTGLDRVGLTRVVEHCFCKKSDKKGKPAMRVLVLVALDDINRQRDDDPPWELSDDGTASQQLCKEHHFVICRYI